MKSSGWHNVAYTWLRVYMYRGLLGGAKVSFILRHRGVQRILAYSWARPAILVAGKGRGGIFISSVSSLSFLFIFLLCPCPSLSSPLLSLLSIFSLSLGDDTKWPTRVDVSLNPNTQNIYIILISAVPMMLQSWRILLEYSYSSTNVVLNMIKISFHLFWSFHWFCYLFAVYKHQSIQLICLNAEFSAISVRLELFLRADLRSY